MSMARAKSGHFSNKYVAEIFPRGIRNALFMFVGPVASRIPLGHQRANKLSRLKNSPHPQDLLLQVSWKGEGVLTIVTKS